jgi:hypothetical protein
MVDHAVSVLKKVMGNQNVDPRRWGWSAEGWGDDIESFYNSTGSILIDQGGYIETLQEDAFITPLVPCETDPPQRPQFWEQWAGENGKRYFTQFPLPSGTELQVGDWSQMRPIDDFKDIWLRVFGAGGWTTEGPCTTRV